MIMPFKLCTIICCCLTVTTSISINGDFEMERDASMVTSDADDSKLSALYSSTSSLSSSSPPTLPVVSDSAPHQVQVVSTSPMMGSTIHIVPQTRNSSSLPPNTLQQQTLTFVHHKDALSECYLKYYSSCLYISRCINDVQ